MKKEIDFFEDIGGGMGVGVSDYELAKRTSMFGRKFLGTVSGVILGTIVARKLQRGDPGGDIRRALATFPFPRYAEKVLNAYFVEGGIEHGARFKHVPMFTINPPWLLISLTVCANYAYVWLAKEGHSNPISINYLEKVAMPHIYSITGAMLAGVDFITMGAGIPFQIPSVINAVSTWGIVSYPIPVIGKDKKNWNHTMSFNLEDFFGKKPYEIKVPGFIPIISYDSLAVILKNKLPKDSIYGFAIERVNEKGEPNSGGHNATPRNKVSYGERDFINYSKILELGIPFWVGGAAASPEMREYILSLGAKGIQVGSILALSEQSGMDPVLRRLLRKLGFNGQLKVRTDKTISPTGYFFKVAIVKGTLSEDDVYESRIRKCDIGGLVSLYERDDGSIGYRCPAEPIDDYKRKGGNPEDCALRGCLCSGLFTNCGLGDPLEPGIVTLGDDLSFLKKLMKHEDDSYSVEDAINYLRAI